MNEFHVFDLDGTLWNIKSDIWIIDKETSKPIITISWLEFSLIRNGIYQNDNIPLEYNGNKFFISRELYDKIYKKTKFENIKRLGISFNSFYNKNILDKSPINYTLDNITHLRGKKNISIGILTARSNLKTHSNVLNKLRIELKNIGISIDKIYFVGDKLSFYHNIEPCRLENNTQISLKKVYVLLEHLLGFKIKKNKFVFLKQDWFTNVYFYDDNKINIDYANDCQTILNNLLKNTDNELFNLIIDRIKSNSLKLYNNLITNNELNKFEINLVNIDTPHKFPLFENVVYYTGNFVDKKKIKKELKTDIKNIINFFILKPIFDYKITNFIVNVINDNKIIEIIIFGIGKPDIDVNKLKDDPLIKLVFTKKNIWLSKYMKSKVYKKIQYRNTEITTENLFSIRDNVLEYLNKKK